LQPAGKVKTGAGIFLNFDLYIMTLCNITQQLIKTNRLTNCTHGN